MNKIILVVILGLVFTISPGRAQLKTGDSINIPLKERRISVSYVFNINAPFGINVALFNKGKLGIYGEAKTNWGIDTKYLYENMNYNEALYTYGDRKLDEYAEYRIFNVGLTYLFHNRIAFYCGPGISIKTNYSRFFDPLYILGNEGAYWVQGPGDKEYGINANGGFQFFLNDKILLIMGVDANPASFICGIGIYFRYIPPKYDPVTGY